MKIFKKATRIEVLNSEVKSIIRELLIHDFSNEEIGFIVKSLNKEVKELLKERQIILENELKETINAINIL